MNRMITLIRYNIIQQVRNSKFYIIVVICMFLGVLCVPGATAGYEIFYLGGVRGAYNSAWLGAMSTLLPVIILWLPGFYLLRSKITEDSELKIGQIIAASPIRKVEYIAGKFISNFFVLLVIQFMFTITLMIMQMIWHESMNFVFLDYLSPLLFISVPYLFVLASCTVLFDTVSFLKGSLGNVLIFILWMIMSTLSVADPFNRMDLFGTGFLLKEMMDGAKNIFPALPDAASFGYYVTNNKTRTFLWSGIQWNETFLLLRFLWIAISLGIIGISVLLFQRFKEPECKGGSDNKELENIKNYAKGSQRLELNEVRRNNHINYANIIRGELRIMMKGHSKWWYLCVVGSMYVLPFFLNKESIQWISLGLLFLMPIWSHMGNKEKQGGTSEFICSGSSPVVKWIATWSSGIIVAVVASVGFFIKLAFLADWSNIISWIVGIYFISTIAIVFGEISGSNRLFEGMFIALLYFGPINNLWKFDFLGLSRTNTIFYALITGILIVMGLFMQVMKERR